MQYLFVYLNIINNKFEGADYEIYSSYLRTFLSVREIRTQQYINYRDSDINVIVEDISHHETQKVVIYINEYNYYISKCLVNNVVKKNKSKQFYCLGPNTEYISRELSSHISISKYLPMNIIEAANEMIREQKRTDLLDNNECMALHPYSKGIVPVSEVYNVGLLSSIGCVGRCSFCSYSKADIFQFDIDILIQELQFIYKNRMFADKIIWFYDDCFSISKKRIEKICKKIIDLKLSFRFWCCLRYDLLDYETLSLLKQAGFSEIVVGLESASPNVLEKLGKIKNDSAEGYLNKIDEIISYCGQVGIHLVLSVNFGLPDENIEDAMKTLEYMVSHNDVEFSVNYMTEFPNSRLFNADLEGNIVDQGITMLPHKTFYPLYNMEYVDRNIRLSRLRDLYIGSYENRNTWKKMLQMITGVMYDREMIRNKLNYLEIDDCEKAIAFIKRNLYSNAIISKKADKLMLDGRKLFCDNRKTLKLNMKSYNKLVAFFCNNDLYFENIALYKEADKRYYKLNNLYRYGEITVEHCDDKATIQKLLSEYELFCARQIFLMGNIRKMIFSNMCMFTGQCSALSNPRLSLRDDKCYLCNSQQQAGDVNQDVRTIRENIERLTGEACECMCINEALRNEIAEIKNRYLRLYVYINTICFITYNFCGAVDDREHVKILSALNYDFGREEIQVTEDFVLIEIRDVLIMYNAKDKIGFIADAEEKAALNMIFVQRRRDVEKTLIKRVTLKLKQLGVAQLE